MKSCGWPREACARAERAMGIETSIIVRAHSQAAPSTLPVPDGPPPRRAQRYEEGHYAGLGDQVQEGVRRIVPHDGDAGRMADAIVKVATAPFGKRPSAVINRSDEGWRRCGFTGSDACRAECCTRGLSDCWNRRLSVEIAGGRWPAMHNVAFATRLELDPEWTASVSSCANVPQFSIVA